MEEYLIKQIRKDITLFHGNLDVPFTFPDTHHRGYKSTTKYKVVGFAGDDLIIHDRENRVIRTADQETVRKNIPIQIFVTGAEINHPFVYDGESTAPLPNDTIWLKISPLNSNWEALNQDGGWSPSAKRLSIIGEFKRFDSAIYYPAEVLKVTKDNHSPTDIMPNILSWELVAFKNDVQVNPDMTQLRFEKVWSDGRYFLTLLGHDGEGAYWSYNAIRHVFGQNLTLANYPIGTKLKFVITAKTD